MASLPLPYSLGGRYVLERQLARGGFGVVYAARPTAEGGGARVAIKLLAAAAPCVAAAEVEAEAAPPREVELLRTLGAHAHIVRLLDAFRAREGHAIVLELCEGSLGSWLPARRSAAAVALALRDTARALAFLHARGIVHRDVKPSNLLMAVDGSVKLADFGLAEFVGAELSITPPPPPPSPEAPEKAGAAFDTSAGGTPYYMSPEAAQGCPPNFSTDIFSLGATAFALVSGRTLLAKFSSLAALYRRAHDETVEPPPADASAELVDFLRQTLQRDPHARPSAMELLAHPLLAGAADAAADAEADGELRAPPGARLQLVVFSDAPAADAQWSLSPAGELVESAPPKAEGGGSVGDQRTGGDTRAGEWGDEGESEGKRRDDGAIELAASDAALNSRQLAARLRSLQASRSAGCTEADFGDL
jgi:serine/threonine protein kinase